MTKVSIIVPVFKVENYIGRCIESIQKQTMDDWEMILVDDAGGDESMSVVKDYASKDRRIKYIENNENCGPMVARSKGYSIARGEYVTFVDGDDTLPNDALVHLYETAISTGSDIVVGNMIRIDQSGNRKRNFYHCINKIWSREELLLELLDNEFPHNLCGKMFKKSLFFNANLKNYDGFTNGEDGLLFYQILREVKSLATIENEVYYYWMIDTSSTHKKITESIVRNGAAFAKFRYDFFKNEKIAFEHAFYKNLYYRISMLSHDIPFSKVKRIFKDNGIEVNFSLRNLLKYFSFIRILKLYYDTYLFSFGIHNKK